MTRPFEKPLRMLTMTLSDSGGAQSVSRRDTVSFPEVLLLNRRVAEIHKAMVRLRCRLRLQYHQTGSCLLFIPDPATLADSAAYLLAVPPLSSSLSSTERKAIYLQCTKC